MAHNQAEIIWQQVSFPLGYGSENKVPYRNSLSLLCLRALTLHRFAQRKRLREPRVVSIFGSCSNVTAGDETSRKF